MEWNQFGIQFGEAWLANPMWPHCMHPTFATAVMHPMNKDNRSCTASICNSKMQ